MGSQPALILCGHFLGKQDLQWGNELRQGNLILFDEGIINTLRVCSIRSPGLRDSVFCDRDG